MLKKKSTITEVAKLAKVGTTSVSRFFHNPKSVSASLQKRILKASDNYGLGVELDFSKLGEPEFIIS